MQGGIAILYAAIVAGADERSVFIENRGANRNAAFGESFAGFGNGDKQHRAEIQRVRHGQKYTRLCYGGVREVIAYAAILSFRSDRNAQDDKTRTIGCARNRVSQEFLRGERRKTSGEKIGYYLSRKIGARKFKECGKR